MNTASSYCVLVVRHAHLETRRCSHFKILKKGGVIWRDDDNVLKSALMLEVNGMRKRGRPK